MRALDRKALRDLWHMKGQAFAIATVIAGGVATLVMSVSVYDSLILTRDAFYRDYRFAGVFASLKRAPESLRPRIEEIPGVLAAETRIAAVATLDVDGFPDPVAARIVSIPGGRQPLTNLLYLRAGRMPEAGRGDEVLASEAFASSHRLKPGDTLAATINGRRKRLRITGLALCPEYIYQLQPGAIIPDFRRFSILWMPRQPLAYAYDMDGAFNDLSIALTANARAEDVIARLDPMLQRYGGLGAIARKDQISNRYLSEEFKQLESLAVMFPTIFLGVAAFLLNVVLNRLLATQREQVAILKAFGYSNFSIVVHYLKIVVLIVLAGSLMGVGFGAWLGSGMASMYMDFYRFPFLLYVLRPRVAILATAVSAAAALLGTVLAVTRAAALPPAEAMQPAPPARYRVSIVERLGLGRLLAQPTRMIIRNLERRPVKSLLSVLGIGFAYAILVTGGFFGDAVDYLLTVQFKLAQRDDLTVTFTEASSRRVLHELRSLPGVEQVEPFRAVPVRLRHEHRHYRTSLEGIPPGATLRRLLDRDLRPVALPLQGVLLTDHLAGILGVKPGRMLTVEVLEGARPVRQVAVAGVVKEYVGLSAYMRLDNLNRLMREDGAVSGAWLRADPRAETNIYSALKKRPRVAATSARRHLLENFYETMGRQVLTFAFFNTLLAGSIAFGVIYNSARIALSERSRELASLRVLGFTRGKISYILLGELGLLTLISLPLGYWIGTALCASMLETMPSDLYRIPLVIYQSTYAWAALVVLVASLVSGIIVRRKLDHLDLVAVLKTKE